MAKKRYGCMMLLLQIPLWEKFQDIINSDDEWINPDPDGFPKGGVEDEQHVTLLYGFHSEVDPQQVMDAVESFLQEPVQINLKDISHFANEKYDVVKLDVESSVLRRINDYLTANFPYTTDHPDYNPHVTLAYVKSGKGKKYDKKGLNHSFELNSLKFKYSDENREPVFWQVDVVPEKLPTLEKYLENN